MSIGLFSIGLTAIGLGVAPAPQTPTVNGVIDVALDEVQASFSGTVTQSTPAINSSSSIGLSSIGMQAIGVPGQQAAQPGSHTIDTYPTDIEFNGVNYNYSTSGLGAITSLTLDDSGGNGPIALTTFTDTTFNGPSLADAIRPLVGSVTLTASDGTNSASQSINLNPASSYTLVTIQAGFSTDPLSWIYDWQGTPQVGMQAQFVTADFNSIDGLGNFEKVGPGASTGYLTDPADNQMYSFDIITGPSVEGVIDVNLEEIQSSFTGNVSGITPTVSGAISVALEEIQASFAGSVSGVSPTVEGGISVTLDQVQASFTGQARGPATTVSGSFNITLEEVTASWSAEFEFQDLEIVGCVNFSEDMNS
ncbi:hypothetical protein FLL45_01605 [Aliikangiella marina]|uniref:Uncharacterized protein n=1 Tax=Aliikangiella marina TaxID=1712262 RepID=A0A545THH7_9GAMM|nr:hypothetical protein [Aliikangiella marina]TQV76683.1 hypothetical protein FLL45_01605 [Aliikangiella marina]